MATAAVPRWKPNKEEQADLDAMNIAVARIKRHTPSDPYYLEIPQENGARYNHHQSQRNQWVRDTPFVRGEMESLQYQTFHLYEQGKEMFEQHSTRLEAVVSNRAGVARAGTPSTAPKNKISLAAYKKKQNAATTTPELKAQKASDAPEKQAAVKGPVERARAETEEMLAAIAEAEPEVPQMRRQEPQATVNDLKRKRAENEQQEVVGGRKGEASKEHGEPVAKKVKPLPETSAERPAVQNTQQRKPGPTATPDRNVTKPVDEQLPPRLSPALSPLLPPRLSPLSQPTAPVTSLPPRLTPTIPLNISKALDAQNSVPSTSQSSLLSAVDPKDKDKDKDVTFTPSRKDATKLTKHKSPQPPRNRFRAGSVSPARRSEEEERLPAGKAAPQPNGAGPPQDDNVVVAKSKSTNTGDKPNDPPILQKPQPRLLLKLKYRKSQASAIKRILGMRAAPKKSIVATEPDVPNQRQETIKSASIEKTNGDLKDGASTVKGVAQKVGPARKEKKPDNQPVAEKRPPTEKPISSSAKPPHTEKQSATEKRKLPAEDRHESPAKRSKEEVPATRKAPSTPAQQVTESPSGSKSQLQATPSARNNLLAVAMARDRSQDSNSTQTPPAIADTPTTSSTSQPNGTARPPSSQPSSKTPMEQAWGAEARLHSKLGKELKHAATAHQNNKLPNSAVSIIDQKLAAVKSIESFLCFMVGFCCLDEAGQAAEPRPHPPEIRNWQSLQGFQGFVKRNTEQFPALAGLTASLNVVFAQRALGIATQYQREDGISRNDIFDMQALLNKSAIEADAKLDVDVLQTSFPRTWNQRAKKGPLPAKEKLELGKLGGQFKLPIGLATSPMRAARAGCALLREWLDGEGISYSLKLKLGGG